VRAAASEDSFAESNERAKRFDLLGPEGSISRYTPNDVSSLSTTTMKTMNSMTLSAVNLYRSDCKGVLHTSTPHDASNSDLAEHQMLTVSAADSYTRAARTSASSPTTLVSKVFHPVARGMKYHQEM
jgi:hypothetical protein